MKRCAGLDGRGKQCRRESIGDFSYHGDMEIYFDHVPTWVLVPLCEIHVQSPSRRPHKQDMRRMRREQREAERQPAPTERREGEKS
jgi:hypothetical protein